jgi:AcrR family transcriptional regulator
MVNVIMAPRRKTEPLSREAWEAAALAVIAEAGVAAVAVEPLARRLGVTKGSFYWHFAGRDELLAAALRRWERLHTEEVIAGLADLAPRDRLARLMATRLEKGDRLYSALGAASTDPVVRPVLKRVAARRLAYLDAIFRDLGFDAEAARQRAFLAGAAYAGLLQLERESQGRLLSGDERARYFTTLVELLGGPA